MIQLRANPYWGVFQEMIDFTYKKEGDLVALSIRTEATEVGTLYRIIACLYALKMDIISGEIATIEENGKLFTLDHFRVQSEDENQDPAFQLGVLMDTVFTRFDDVDILLKEYNPGEPSPEQFFRENFEFIFTDDPETRTTCFYMESDSGRGLLYHITRVLMKNGINILSAKIETDPETSRARDSFYLVDKNNNPLEPNGNLTEKIKREIYPNTES